MNLSAAENREHARIDFEADVPFVSVQEEGDEVLLLGGTTASRIAVCAYRDSMINIGPTIELVQNEKVLGGLIIPLSEFRHVSESEFKEKCGRNNAFLEPDSVITMFGTEEWVWLYSDDSLCQRLRIRDALAPDRIHMMFLLKSMNRVLAASWSGHHAFYELLTTKTDLCGIDEFQIVGMHMTDEVLYPESIDITGMDVLETDTGVEVHCVSHNSRWTKTTIRRQ